MTEYYRNTQQEAEQAKLAIKAAFESATHPYGTERNRFCFHTSVENRRYLIDKIKAYGVIQTDERVGEAVYFTLHALKNGDLPDRSYTTAAEDKKLEQGMDLLTNDVADIVAQLVIRGNDVPRFATPELLSPEKGRYTAYQLDHYL